MKMKLLFAMCAVALTGCGSLFVPGDSNYACPGMPKGVTCKTPREAYDLSISKPAQQKKGKAPSGYNPGPVEVALTNGEIANDTPLPVLEQAKVMRIWIAPWIDKNKDLHWPGMVFTQIQIRQWSIGDDNFEGVEPPVPHKGFAKPAPLKAKPSADRSSAGMVVGKQLEAGNAQSPKVQDEVLN